MAYISKGITLWHVNFLKPGTNNPVGIESNPFGATELDTELTALQTKLTTALGSPMASLIPDIQEFGDLGTSASAERDKIEITTLADDKHVYTNGLLADAGEQNSIDFKFLYTPLAYTSWLSTIESERDEPAESVIAMVIPNLDGGYNVFKMTGNSSVKLDGTSYNNALTYTLTFTPCKEIEFVEVKA